MQTLRKVRQRKDAPRAAHPTHELLTRTALDLLSRYEIEDISAEMILQSSGVSKGSLYHHFEDLADLLETALVRRFTRNVDESIVMARQMLANAPDRAAFNAAMAEFHRINHTVDRRQNRIERARLLGLSHNNPRLARRLGEQQTRLTSAFADVCREAQTRGWMADDVDPMAASVLVQAYTLGRVIDDIASEHMDQAGWDKLLIKLIENVFGMKN